MRPALKQRELRLPAAMAMLAMLILAGSASFEALAPIPGAQSLARAHSRDARQMHAEIAKAAALSRNLEKCVRPRLWQGSAESVTALVLKAVAEHACGLHVKLTGFRPQKAQALKGVTELPFIAHVSGRYPSVRAMVAALDAPGTRIAVRSAQFASADDSTSAVTAALNLSAFVAEPGGSRPETEPGGNRD